MAPDTTTALTQVLARDPRVRAAWLFGSRARDEVGPDRDIDVGVLLGEDMPLREELKLRGALTEALHRDDIDLVILDRAPPLLCFEVISAGRRLLCRDSHQADDFEARVMREYLDTAWLRKLNRQLAREAAPR